MYLKRYFPFTLFKSILLIGIVLSAFFINGTKAEAVSKIWHYYSGGEMVYNPLCVSAIAREDLGGYWYSDGDSLIAVPPEYRFVFEFSDEGINYSFFCPDPQQVPNEAPSATFSASSDRDIYNPGDPISVTVSAGIGYRYGGDWIDSVASFFGFGGRDPERVASQAYLFGATPTPTMHGINGLFAECWADDACSASGSVNAPNTPERYTITLNGCWLRFDTMCSQSSMEITVTAPVVWTNYCTGANDPNGNNWQIWARSNSDPPGYKFIETGTSANGCVGGAPVISISFDEGPARPASSAMRSGDGSTLISGFKKTGSFYFK